MDECLCNCSLLSVGNPHGGDFCPQGSRKTPYAHAHPPQGMCDNANKPSLAVSIGNKTISCVASGWRLPISTWGGAEFQGLGYKEAGGT